MYNRLGILKHSPFSPKWLIPAKQLLLSLKKLKSICTDVYIVCQGELLQLLCLYLPGLIVSAKVSFFSKYFQIGIFTLPGNQNL